MVVEVMNKRVGRRVDMSMMRDLFRGVVTWLVGPYLKVASLVGG